MNAEDNAKVSQSTLIADLRSLLHKGVVTTQEDICAALEALGHSVNQSKVSRLLRKIGAIKSKNELGEIVYRLQMEPAPPTISDQIANLVIDVVANEANVIVNTSPGAAQLLARILDYHKEKLDILATIAGDDVVLIAPVSVKRIKQCMQNVIALLF